MQLGDIVLVPRRVSASTLPYAHSALAVAAESKQLSSSSIRVYITVTADFSHGRALHGAVLGFYEFVLDGDGERILRARQLLKLMTATRSLPTRRSSPRLLPFANFVRVESDEWLGCTTAPPVLLATTVVPERVPAPKELLAPQQLQTATGLPSDFFGFAAFDAIQTQVCQAAYEAGDALRVAAIPLGKGPSQISRSSTISSQEHGLGVIGRASVKGSRAGSRASSPGSTALRRSRCTRARLPSSLRLTSSGWTACGA